MYFLKFVTLMYNVTQGRSVSINADMDSYMCNCEFDRYDCIVHRKAPYNYYSMSWDCFTSTPLQSPLENIPTNIDAYTNTLNPQITPTDNNISVNTATEISVNNSNPQNTHSATDDNAVTESKINCGNGDSRYKEKTVVKYEASTIHDSTTSLDGIVNNGLACLNSVRQMTENEVIWSKVETSLDNPVKEMPGTERIDSYFRTSVVSLEQKNALAQDPNLGVKQGTCQIEGLTPATLLHSPRDKSSYPESDLDSIFTDSDLETNAFIGSIVQSMVGI